MEKHSIKARWLGNLAFEGLVTGHKITVDAKKETGGEDKGASPKQLMLLALAGCTGIDVTSILAKMKVDLKDLNITVEAGMTEDHPKHYTEMHVIYEFTGRDLPYDKLKRAVELSEQKYCGVHAVYKKAINMSSEIRVINI
ncbi:MAG TPA: OsmC family protein [Bacteroidales bacterium]|nr:OsmC family protein [Bacteroidales bacterium]